MASLCSISLCCGSKKQLTQYREYVEGGTEGKRDWTEPDVVQQAFIGDEEFVETARQKAQKASVVEGHYSLKRIVAAVSKVSGVKEEELRHPQRSEIAQRSREMVSYVSRRHSDVGLGELAKFLQVKELSTPSHG